MSTRHVLVVGDVNADLLCYLPVPGVSTPLPELVQGGTGGNTAVALARLGLPTCMLTATGDDYFGNFVRGKLQEAGVSTRCVHTIPNAPNDIVIALMNESHDMIAGYPFGGSLFNYIRVEDIERQAVEQAAWVHISGTCLIFPRGSEVLHHVMQMARAAGVPVSFDINLRIHGKIDMEKFEAGLRRAISESDVVFGSAVDELPHLAPAARTEESARILADSGRTVVARMGAGGALAVQGDECVQVPAFPVTVVDTLGAGDTFNAGYILASLQGLPLAERLRYGNATAALRLMRAGGVRGGPTRAALETFLTEHPAPAA